MGEHEVSSEEWQALLASKSELVYFRGQWVEIDTSEMEKMQKLIESQIKDKATGSIQDLFGSYGRTPKSAQSTLTHFPEMLF